MNCFLHHRHGIKDIIIVYVVNHKSYLLCVNIHFFLPQTDGVPGIGTALSIKLLLKKTFNLERDFNKWKWNIQRPCWWRAQKHASRTLIFDWFKWNIIGLTMWATCPSAPPIFHLSKPRKVWTAAKWKWKCFLFSTMWIFQWKVFFGPAMWLLLLELPLLLLPLLLPHTAVEGLTLEGSSTSYAQVKTPRKQNTEYKIHFRITFKILFNCCDKK